MSILSRYLTFEILKYFGLMLAMVVGVYLAVECIEKIDNFMDDQMPIPMMVRFFLYKTPFIVAQITPVGLLLAILIVFGLMSKHHEIIALQSGGISIYDLVRPVVLIGAVFSLLLFVVAELVVPLTMERANRIRRLGVDQKMLVTAQGTNIWLKGPGTINYIAYYNPKDHSIKGVRLNFFDERFNLARRVDARQGYFEAGQWVLSGIMEQVRDRNTGTYQVHLHEELRESLDLAPADLQRVAKKSEEMGFFELKQFVRKVEAEGYDATVYRVDLYAKVAFPAICLIMSLLGTGLAARGKLTEGLPLSITYGLGLAFTYWVFYSFCLSLGYSGMLPPLLAAWTANFMFLCIGLMALLHAE
jgi:lipopolysaccharide export system permease protein